MNRSLATAGIALLPCSAVLAQGDAPPSALQCGRNASLVTVTAGDQPVMTYRHGDAPFKPYVKTLHTPSGVQILRDSPSDHVHHRGLMYAVEINGADFWGETKRSGKQVPASEVEAAAAPGRGVRIVHRLSWISAGSDKPVAVEERLIEAHGTVHGATLLTWRLSLKPADGQETIAIQGSHYQGLGLRFVQSMDGSEKFRHASGDASAVVRGSERVTPSAWTAYTAPASGHPVTVAIFDHPKNVRHPAGMFTMHKPFSYLSATPNVWKTRLDLNRGETLVLRYGVGVWDGDAVSDTIERVYQAWLKLSDAGAAKP
jgi:hypothetical protein